MPGQFMWFDLNAADAGQAREFYSAMFGWPVTPAENAGAYRAWITDGQQPWAGIADAGAVGHWLPYVAVEDLDEAAKRAVALASRADSGIPAERKCSGLRRTPRRPGQGSAPGRCGGV